jgi:hypothetical protein
VPANPAAWIMTLSFQEIDEYEEDWTDDDLTDDDLTDEEIRFKYRTQKLY